MNHFEFETKLLDILLAGENKTLKGLRLQLNNSTIISREFTGAGFFSSFSVKKGIPDVFQGKSFQISDVHASYKNIENAFGFVLFIKKGYLSTLEGYTLLVSKWPKEYSSVILKYIGDMRERDLKQFENI